MKTKGFLGVGVLLLACSLLVLPGAAQAEMYVEGYIGGNFGGNVTDSINGIADYSNPWTFNPAGHINPAVVGGLKLGTWFVKEGFLGMNYPDWMKYLGFYVDFSYHRVDIRRGQGRMAADGYPVDFWSEGNAATLAFMFAARYGFFADSEVPFGRLQPYVAVGPAILFSSQTPTLSYIPEFGPAWIKAPSQSSADIALAVEAGMRYMALKNVSLDVSFKYRYANPSYHYSGLMGSDGSVNNFTFSPTYNFFSFQVGAAYHF